VAKKLMVVKFWNQARSLLISLELSNLVKTYEVSQKIIQKFPHLDFYSFTKTTKLISLQIYKAISLLIEKKIQLVSLTK
jgi:hypothetical protein